MLKRRHLVCLGAVLTIGSHVYAAESTSSDYIIQPGDQLQLTVGSIPDLRAKTAVDLDGEIHLPLLPPIKAGNQTLNQLLSQVRAQMKSKIYRQILPDGRENLLPIDPDDVTMEIASYRPLYVRGDVSKPGELPFRPGLTVRQVIALAGGYDVMRFRLENPFLQAYDLRAEYQDLWTDFARSQARAAVLKAHVDGTEVPDLLKMLKVPLSEGVVQQIVSTEVEQGKAELSDHNRQRLFLQRQADISEKQSNSFVKPKDDALRSETDDLAYKQKLGDLLDKGTIAHERVAEQQRTLLESTQRYLDYSQRISDLNKTRDDFSRQKERLDDQYRAQLLKELQDTNVRIASTRDKLQAVGEKLLYVGAMRSQLVSGRDTSPQIEIHRNTKDGIKGFKGDENTVLLPDDVVDVALSAELVPAGTVD